MLGTGQYAAFMPANVICLEQHIPNTSWLQILHHAALDGLAAASYLASAMMSTCFALRDGGQVRPLNVGTYYAATLVLDHEED